MRIRNLIAPAAGAFACLLVATGMATPASAGTFAAPASIDSTGATDVTAALQSWLDSVPDNSTLTFPAGAKYRIEGTLTLWNRHGLDIEGNGATFYATTTGDRTRSQWRVSLGGGFVFRNVVVRGANPNAGISDAAYVASLEAQHAFDLWSVDGVELDHVTATDTYGDFVYIGAQQGPLSQNIWIHDSTFDRNGRQGVSVTGGKGVLFEHNSIQDTRRATFDLEPNGPDWGAFDVTIRNNYIGWGRLNMLSSAGNGPVSNIKILDNQVDRQFLVYVGDTLGGRRSGFDFERNVATWEWGGTAGSAPITMYNVDGLTVADNTIPVQAGRGDYGVLAGNACLVAVTGNAFPGAIGPLSMTSASSCSTAPAPSPSPTTTSPAPSPTTSSPAPSPTTSSPAPAPTTSSPVPTTSSPAPSPTTTASPAPTSSPSPSPVKKGRGRPTHKAAPR